MHANSDTAPSQHLPILRRAGNVLIAISLIEMACEIAFPPIASKHYAMCR